MNQKVLETNNNIATTPTNYNEDIIKIIRSNSSPTIIQKQLKDYHENDIAIAMENFLESDRKKLYRILDIPVLANVFEYLDEDEAEAYIGEMDLKKASFLISEMESDSAVLLLKKIEKEKRLLIIEMLDEKIRKDVAMIASFDEDEIGSKMTTNCIVIKNNLTTKQAMKELIRQAEKNDNITTLFVTDENEFFYGAIDLKDLIIARETQNLNDLILTSFPYVYGHEEIDDCIEKLKDYSEQSVPVLDNNNKILGVITSQNIIDVVDDEMGEDYAKLAGLTAEEDLSETIFKSMRKRLPWLLVLLFLGLLVSSVVGIFENVISQLTLIIAFQSLILDMSGNVGTQSLAVTIRVLMDESLSTKQKIKLVFKEMRVGFFNGTVLGILSFIFVGLYVMIFKHKTLLFSFAISGCIGISLLVAMLISSAIGTLVPLFFKKIKVDPAVASGPLITTINDLVAVVTYYGLSWLFLLQIMKF